MTRTIRFDTDRRRWFPVSVSLGIAAAFAFLAGVSSPTHAADAPVLSQLRVAAEKIAPLHQKKQPPSADNWLASHPERGQTFEQYRHTNPNRPTKIRTTLYVQPIGEFTVAQ